MITRLYVDNFKTLVNFELKLGPMNLLLGANGSGKSTVLDAIRLIRKLVCDGETSNAIFPTSSLCRWDSRKVQTFEVDLRNRDGTIDYAYRLEVEHETEGDGCYVKREELLYDRQPVYVSVGGNGEFHRSNGVLQVKFARDRSGVGIIQDGALLSDFKQRLEVVWPLHINANRMLPECDSESVRPDEEMSNFAGWYRHLTLDRSADVFKLAEVLRNDVLDGLRSLRLKAVGEKARALWVEFGVKANDNLPDKPTEYRFNELSDGQRMLIALYALVTCAVDEENTLCLDHPETYLALPEIQPWLLRLADAAEEGRCQAIIATHHPELINLLAASSGYWLERQSGGPTRVKRIGDQDSSGLPVSELIARGWLHG
jgi:predicted ATPase